jgi:L-fuculose-phosphate aldolase
MNYKNLLVESGLRLMKEGLTIGTWGNISARDPETGLVYLTPSAMNYEEIQESDIVVSKLDGTIVEGTRKPTVEKEMHLSVYRSRSNVNAMIHTHPIYSMVFAAQGRSIPRIIDEAAQNFGGDCLCTEYRFPGTKDIADACADALGEHTNVCLLRNHGAVCVGRDMNAAFTNATVLEYTARLIYMIESEGGKPCGFTDEQVAFLENAWTHYGQDKE